MPSGVGCENGATPRLVIVDTAGGAAADAEAADAAPRVSGKCQRTLFLGVCDTSGGVSISIGVGGISEMSDAR